jgi:hypothetical protein
MAIGIGQKVRVTKIRDGLSTGLKQLIENQAVGEVKGYRVLDGTNVGIVVKFSDEFSTWFFEDEVEPASGGRFRR